MSYCFNLRNMPEPSLDPPEDTRRVFDSCCICEEYIYEGEEYYDIPGFGCCCKSCIEDAYHMEAECD